MTNIDGVGVPAGAGAAAKPKCESPAIDLDVKRNLLTLKHDRANRLKIIIQPATCRATEFRIEIQSAAGGGWFKLSSKRNFLWLARVAGKFKLRGTAKIEGTEYQSGLKDVEVQFPSYDKIVGDALVKKATHAEWVLTVKDCKNKPGLDYQGTRQPNLRRERGFFIRIDTRANRYIFTNPGARSWVGPGEGAFVTLGRRPEDDPISSDPNAKGAKYVVASFHAHTATTYRPGPGTRDVGPSARDDINNKTRQIPGVVYDYVDSPVGSGSIPMGHRKWAKARRYRSLGLNRRPTP